MAKKYKHRDSGEMISKHDYHQLPLRAKAEYKPVYSVMHLKKQLGYEQDCR